MTESVKSNCYVLMSFGMYISSLIMHQTKAEFALHVSLVEF